jgi:hypothetical protein
LYISAKYLVFVEGGELVDVSEIFGENALRVFGVPVVESENDIAIFLCFGEFDVGLVGDEEWWEVGVVGDAFIEEAFLVSGAAVCFVFGENKDSGNGF